jgi:hypothetical protein
VVFGRPVRLAMAAEPLPWRHSLKAYAKNVILAVTIVAKHQVFVIIVLSAHPTAVLLLLGRASVVLLTFLDSIFCRIQRVVVLPLVKTFQKRLMLLKRNELTATARATCHGDPNTTVAPVCSTVYTVTPTYVHSTVLYSMHIMSS